MAQKQTFPSAGTIRNVGGQDYVSTGSEFIPMPASDKEASVAIPEQTMDAPVAPERSFRDVLSSGVDTVAEFLPAAGAALGSVAGTPGALLGYAGGQGIRELVQRGGEIPGAVRDIYRNLRDGDPNVRLAMLKGASQGVAQGTGNLVPGGRGAQAAVSSLREGNPYTAAAQAIGAGLDVATVGASGPIRTMFTNAPVRSTMATLLGLGGAKVGEGIGGVVADVADLTPDQRVLAETLAAMPGFAVGAGSMHPKVQSTTMSAAQSPLAQAAMGAAVVKALGGTNLQALAAATSGGLVNKSARMAKDFLDVKRETNAINKEKIASNERIQSLRQQAKDSDSAPVTRVTGAEGTMIAETIKGILSGARRVLTTEEMKYPEIVEAWKLVNAQRQGMTHAARTASATVPEREAVIKIEAGKEPRKR